MTGSCDLSIVIPCYNESGRIGFSLAVLFSFLERQTRSFEVIVVDDGSTDATLAMVQAFAEEHPRLTVLPLGVNRGKGRAVREGMLAASGRVVLFMDADLATPLTEIEKVVVPVEKNECDVAMGSRVLEEGSIKQAQPWVRSHVTGPGFRLAARLSVGLSGLWDLQCGFKAFSARAARMIFPVCMIDRFAFDVEAIVVARRRGLTVKEIAVDWADRPGSKVKIWRDAPRMARDLLRIRRNIQSGRYEGAVS